MAWFEALDKRITDYLPDLEYVKDEPMAKHRGIRYLMRNVNAMLADLQNGKVRFDGDTQAKLMRGLGEFVRFADHYRHGDINARLGNEVMLDIV